MNARISVLLLLVLAMAGCGRNHMDRPLSARSEKAFQESYARFEREASDEERASLVAGISSVSTVTMLGPVFPPQMRKTLTNGLPPFRSTIWQTLGGHSPREIIEWGAVLRKRMSSLPPQ